MAPHNAINKKKECLLCGAIGDSLVRYAKKYVGSNPTTISK